MLTVLSQNIAVMCHRIFSSIITDPILCVCVCVCVCVHACMYVCLCVCVHAQFDMPFSLPGVDMDVGCVGVSFHHYLIFSIPSIATELKHKFILTTLLVKYIYSSKLCVFLADPSIG